MIAFEAAPLGLACVSERPAPEAQPAADPLPGVTQLTTDPGEDSAPRWSADGSRLLFQSNRSGNLDIYQLRVRPGPATSSTPEPLTTSEAADTYPAFSPNGDRIVFQSDRHNTPGLYLKDLPTGEIRLLLEDSSSELTPDWSPDGQWIAFTSVRSGNPDLWAVPAFGGEPRRLTANPFRDAWPRWSPGGRSLLFFSRRDTDGQRDELYVMDWPEGAVTRLTHNPEYHDFAPSWSPDGRHVVTGISDSVHDRALAIYDLEGRRVTRLGEGYHRVFQPAWSPSGRWIVYAARAAEGMAADLFIAPVPEMATSRAP